MRNKRKNILFIRFSEFDFFKYFKCFWLFEVLILNFVKYAYGLNTVENEFDGL